MRVRSHYEGSLNLLLLCVVSVDGLYLLHRYVMKFLFGVVVLLKECESVISTQKSEFQKAYLRIEWVYLERKGGRKGKYIMQFTCTVQNNSILILILCNITNMNI